MSLASSRLFMPQCTLCHSSIAEPPIAEPPIASLHLRVFVSHHQFNTSYRFRGGLESFLDRVNTSGIWLEQGDSRSMKSFPVDLF